MKVVKFVELCFFSAVRGRGRNHQNRVFFLKKKKTLSVTMINFFLKTRGFPNNLGVELFSPCGREEKGEKIIKIQFKNPKPLFFFQ